MADNVEITAGSGITIGADEINSVKYQRIKLIHGADGTNDGDVSTANPLPVDIRSDNVGGLEVIQDTAADLNMTEANSSSILTAVQAIQTAVEILDNIVAGTEAQVDIVSAPTLTVDATGQGDVPVTLAGEEVTINHAITNIAHGVKTITSAGTDEALASSTACKKVVIQAQTDNTGWIAVGASGVDATEATGTGVLLGAGDSFELEIDNLSDVYIDATVSGEGVRYTYFT